MSEDMQKLPPEVAKKWMTLEEACETLGMHRTTIWRKCKAELLESDLYNQRVIISRGSVARYLKRYTEVA